ncbi:MAG: hypothetical protein KatS3mg105_2187 [Gemmatales bacterium]|nr:MAG: hypothetical protein KatS3mg105_2187 [Gemmatales bacterium]
MWQQIVSQAPVSAVMAALSSTVYFFCTLWLQHYWAKRVRRKQLQAVDAYAEKHGHREVAMVLSVLTDIHQSAQEYLKEQGRTGMKLFQVHQKEGFGEREEYWSAYLEQVKKQVAEIRELGITRIYLFANIPVAMAVFAGAVLANGPEVIVHHFNGRTYQPIGRLRVETVRM